MPDGSDSPLIRACIDRVLPPDLDSAIQLRARKANSRNKVQRTRLDEASGQAIGIGFEYGKCWEPGRTLHIRFLDPDPAVIPIPHLDVVKERVKQTAMQWTEYANIHFAFDDRPDAEIRISFTPGGSWSWIGIDCLMFPQDQPTMNLGWLKADTPQAEYDRVVLHEFGHALGAVHEHRRAEADIPWNVEAVIEYYAKKPNEWLADYTISQVIDRYTKDQVNGSRFDPDSIMIYAVPKELTLGGFEIPWPNGLSQCDKEWAAYMYPPEGAPEGKKPCSDPLPGEQQ